MNRFPIDIILITLYLVIQTSFTYFFKNDENIMQYVSLSLKMVTVVNFVYLFMYIIGVVIVFAKILDINVFTLNPPKISVKDVKT